MWAEVRATWKEETCRICAVVRICSGKRFGFLIVKLFLPSVQLFSMLYNGLWKTR